MERKYAISKLYLQDGDALIVHGLTDAVRSHVDFEFNSACLVSNEEFENLPNKDEFQNKCDYCEYKGQELDDFKECPTLETDSKENITLQEMLESLDYYKEDLPYAEVLNLNV